MMILPSNEKIAELVSQLRSARVNFAAIASENIQPNAMTMLQESADALEALAKDREWNPPAEKADLRDGPGAESVIKRYARDIGVT